MIFNNITSRVPGRSREAASRYRINLFGLRYRDATASNLVLIVAAEQVSTKEMTAIRALF